MRIMRDAETPKHLTEPDLNEIEKTTIEVRLSAEKKDAAFSLIFIAGTQGRIVEANEELTDNMGGYKQFLADLISDKPEAYLEVDRLYSYDCLFVQKLNDKEVLLRIFAPESGEPVSHDDEPPMMYIETIVGYRKFVWELYTSFINLPNIAKDRLPEISSAYCKVPEIEKWLDMRCERDWHLYTDDIFGDELMFNSFWERG